MNTIEQAAKRLAELKRAGYDVPVPDVPGTAAAQPAPAAAAVPSAAPVAPAAVAPVPAPASAPAPVSAATLPTVRSAQVEMLPTAGRRSREVRLDLERLEREGYLVPSQARSQLAEQMRIIKRPLLANARGESAQ